MAIDWTYRPTPNDALDRFNAGFDQGTAIKQDRDRRKALSAYLPDAMQGDPAAIKGLAQGAPDVAAEFAKLNPSDRKRSLETWDWIGQALVNQDGSPISDEASLSRVKTLAKARGINPQIVDSVTLDRVPMLIQTSGAAREYAMKARNTRTFEQDLELRRAGASTTNINMAGEREFEKKTGAAQADMFAELSKDGMAAKADMASIDELAANLAKTPGGFTGGLQQFALSWGVPLGEGATEAQAANAIISKLVPSQRPPGSGPMSDRDVLLFKDSLPKLLNTREGNALIVQTMKAMAEYRIKTANIATAAMTGEITRAEASQLLSNLENPMAEFKRARAAGAKTMPGAPSSKGVPQPKTPQDYERLPPGSRFVAPDGSIRVKP
jgi:hypothetical protein